ncbi:hypothetical protein [Chitinophaga sp. sic0106]|uniref:hypothetical protein n=1 Tax=Chitinophaga sp. sic0106 TaxID=2854785 RepID=UPI001C48ED44|nr:hypothetical protein [Chitinophaga sp. sic0106]MBV7532991.1 hypothetical protein [Chitinophaga sp. sic0106]
MSSMKVPGLRYQLAACPILFASTILISSCQKKETEQLVMPSTKIETEVTPNYLQFKSMAEFRKTMTAIRNTSPDNTQKILNSYSAGNSFYSAYQARLDKGNAFSSKARTAGDDPIPGDDENDNPDPGLPEPGAGPSAPLEPLDELLPDEYLNAMLNSLFEIQIENTVYKVTRHGVFLSTPTMVARMRTIVDSLEATNTRPQGEYEALTQSIKPIITGEQVVNARMTKIQNGIFRYKNTLATLDGNAPLEDGSYTNTSRISSTVLSFDDNPDTDDHPDLGVITDNGGGLGSPTPPFTGIPLASLNTFPSYDFSATTWIGKLIEQIMGRTGPQFQYFDDTHRVKVNFYNVDLMFYASIGINVKMQTKGWTNIWRKLNTDAVVLGWDALIFDIPIDQTINPPYDPSLKPALEKGHINLGTLKLDVKQWVAPISSLFDTKLQKFLEGQAADLANDQFQSLLSSLWGYAYQYWGAEDYNNYQTSVKTLRVSYPAKVKVVIGRFETYSLNASQITENFDWNASVKATFNPNGDMVTLSSVSGNAKSYSLQSASIYGAAKYNGTWQGARIIKK